MVELQDVFKMYPQGEGEVRALDGVDLTVAAGEFVVVTGRSGSGKTTLLSVVGGLTRPDRGLVRVAGRDIWAMGDRERSRFRCRTMGFVFQFASLIPTLSVVENVLLPTAFCPGGSGLGARARQLLERVGLGDRAASYPWQLSGGQQKRVAVARALLLDPPLVLADEPTGDLDEETETEIMDLFRERNAAGTTVIMVTHNTALAAHATRHLVMSRGRLEPAPARV
ncbi:ABC transporter ATP-binding protein [Caldinitratiruptor microaerophilus]|uniref:ABC transporter ATP-binding protein n=1 Tax=Caldinitratiruptor microaerophilus TaxID=671077 RepID=A0AA35CNA2_9FIRM|nr:ABC transporter ATP-binding protein [Caldinitratiruptor microaerophilus]BDG60717.1 ABC transporter ATP-binding protein [Caldinitratiruptor microaerophilus]